MNKEMFQKFIYFGVFFIFGLLFILFPNNALAVEHDLRLSGIIVESLEGCRYLISVQILVIGTNDYEIESGDVTIQISYQKNEGAWTSNGYIVVTRDEMDLPFRQWAVWPIDFDSDPNNNTIFDPPCNGEYRFKATIIYDIDQNPGNNERESSSVSVTCAGECRSWIGTLTEFAGLKALEKAMRGGYIIWKLCEEHPEYCPFVHICDLDPRLCQVRGEMEILFDNSINHLKLAVITKSGIIISKMEQLKKPIIVGDIKYNQRLKFSKSKDMVYRLTYWPTKETRVTEKLPFPIIIRPLKQKSK